MQDTGDVREHDSRGKHTTTARSLHRLPGGACLIDTPGLRGLRPDIDEADLGAAFGDIAQLAGDCRFRDCRHGDEPGCAVRAGVDADRLRNYQKMLRDLRRDTLTALERRQQLAMWKARGRAGAQRMKMKRGTRLRSGASAPLESAPPRPDNVRRHATACAARGAIAMPTARLLRHRLRHVEFRGRRAACGRRTPRAARRRGGELADRRVLRRRRWSRSYGRAALAHYVDGVEGRSMRSIKSILGSDLMDEATEIGAGHAVRYVDVVIAYLRHLRKGRGRTGRGAAAGRCSAGPWYFDDDDAARDRRAQDTLAQAARIAGFSDVRFQYEPIAAALEFESRSTREHLVLVADIGGGTSDFSVVRTSPQRHARLDRRDDILANHGVHIAGTDFDRTVNLTAIMPALGYGSAGPRRPHRAVERLLRTCDLAPDQRREYAAAHCRIPPDARHVRRRRRACEAVARPADAPRPPARGAGRSGQDRHVDCTAPRKHRPRGRRTRHERCLGCRASGRCARGRTGADRHCGAAKRCGVRGCRRDDVDVVYFTGGSTGLDALVARIGAALPRAQRVAGDRFASVASGLGIYARRLFDAAPHT